MDSLISPQLRAELRRHRMTKVALPSAPGGKAEYARMCSDCGDIWPCWAGQAFEALKKAEQERKEHEASFDIRWKADMRAIKRWQKANGQPNMWPDHADLCVWLMGRLEETKAKLAVALEADGSTAAKLDLDPARVDRITAALRQSDHAAAAALIGLTQEDLARLEARGGPATAEADRIDPPNWGNSTRQKKGLPSKGTAAKAKAAGAEFQGSPEFERSAEEAQRAREQGGI